MKPDRFNAIQPEIPVFAHIRQEGQLDLWLSACTTIFGVSPINKEDAAKNYRVAAWFVDPITIISSEYHDMVTNHSRWHVDEAGDQINVHRYPRGRASLETVGLPVECETGDITLLDFSRPFTSIHTSSACHSFFVPHTAINYRPSDQHHSPVYSETSPIGRLIGQEMDNILAQLENGASSVNSTDVRRFLGCVEVGMSQQGASDSARAQARNSLKLTIMKFIEGHLVSPDLSVTLILQNFGVSRASLYRMFDAEDGVRNYIRRRRLYRAVHNIAENPLQRGQIHAAVERWGFTSDTSFNRMVRSEFGVAPGSLFQMPIRGPDRRWPLSEVQSRWTLAARPETVAA